MVEWSYVVVELLPLPTLLESERETDRLIKRERERQAVSIQRTQ